MLLLAGCGSESGVGGASSPLSAQGGNGQGGGGSAAGSAAGGKATAGAKSEDGPAPRACPWTGSAPQAACPAEAPSTQTCGAELELASCNWAQQDGYTSCLCVATRGAENRWSCHGAVGGPNCPVEAPDEATSCSGHEGSTCPYLDRTLACVTATSTWATVPAKGPTASPSLVDTGIAGEPPVDGCKQVKDLSADEAQAFCAWYVEHFPGEPGDPVEPPATKPGFATGFAAIASAASYAEGCIQRMPVDLCVKNLRLNPCEAPVAELSACVQTFWEMSPQNHIVRGGCGYFQRHKGCAQTVVVPGGAASCAAPIE